VKVIKVLLICVFLILSACKEESQITILNQNNDIIFDFSAINEKFLDSKLIIKSMDVVRKDCKADCVMWTLEGDENSQPIKTIKYGKMPPRMQELLSSKPLVRGNYAAGGTVLFVEGERVLGQVMFYGVFTFLKRTRDQVSN